MPAEVRNMSEIYFLPGKLLVKKLSCIDRFILKIGARLTKDEATKKAMVTGYNDVKKEHLTEILFALKKIPLLNLIFFPPISSL